MSILKMHGFHLNLTGQGCWNCLQYPEAPACVGLRWVTAGQRSKLPGQAERPAAPHFPLLEGKWVSLGGPPARFQPWFRSSCLGSRLSTAVAGRVAVAVPIALVLLVRPRGASGCSGLSPKMSGHRIRFWKRHIIFGRNTSFPSETFIPCVKIYKTSH